MGDDEQFSLCWNNFNSNLSAGFHESLCRGDLVDVTLAAEGQLVKAHRLVLSVCSPYFRKMFTQMPANQHAFVFLKDVSHTALKDLIQFMYCGEVNVKQEALPAFISTAEALQIKGLTDSDPPTSQSPAKPSTPAPQPSPIQQISSPRVRHRASTSRSYNIESIDDSVEDTKQATQIVIQTTTPQKAQTTIVQQPQQQQHQHHQTQQHFQPQQTATTVTTTNVTHKRPAQRSSGVTSQTKRTKSTIDPLEATENAPSSQQISMQTVVADNKPAQQQNEAEFIDLPIELPTKSEPDYTEETGEEATAEQETTYVEDDSYGDMRYDESYFTENEDAANTTATAVDGNISGAGASTSKAIVKQQAFSDSSYAEASDQTNNEAQVFLKDVSHTALKDLIQFMYCGEVNVKKEALHAFISTAEALQIKGLTDKNDVPATQTPTKPFIPDSDECLIQQLPLSSGRHHSSLTLDSYNIKTCNSNEIEQGSEFLLPTPLKAVTLKSESFSKQQFQSQQTVAKTSGTNNKRSVQRSIDEIILTKRSRNAIGAVVLGSRDELDIKCNSEILNLPIKSEPVFMEETVKKTTYNEMRYDDSISPENDPNKNITNVKNIKNDYAKCSLNNIARQEDISNNYNVEVLTQTTCASSQQESNTAIYSATSRGRVQLIYGGQPFIFEKNLKLPGGEEKKYWRCNQWWNQKCRSRVFTINDIVVPLNRYHTHEEIVKRKKRVRKIAQTTIPGKSCSTSSKKGSIVTSAPTTIDVTEMSMHLKYEEIVADVTEMVVTTDPLAKDDKK